MSESNLLLLSFPEKVKTVKRRIFYKVIKKYYKLKTSTCSPGRLCFLFCLPVPFCRLYEGFRFTSHFLFTERYTCSYLVSTSLSVLWLPPSLFLIEMVNMVLSFIMSSLTTNPDSSSYERQEIITRDKREGDY